MIIQDPSNGSFNQAQLTLAGQANKAVCMLYIKLSKFSNLKPDFMLALFDKFIAPILNYGCEVWGFRPAPNIELIALRFYKNVLGVKKSTQNDFVYGELGRTPMIVMRHMRIIKYWLNIVMGNKSPYVAGLYHFFMRQVDINNKPSWVRSVKHCWVEQDLEMCGLIRVLGTLIYSWIFLSKGWLTHSAKNGTGGSKSQAELDSIGL